MTALSIVTFVLCALAISCLMGRLIPSDPSVAAPTSMAFGIGLIIIVQSSLITFVSATDAFFFGLLLLVATLGVGLVVIERSRRDKDLRFRFRPWVYQQLFALIAALPSVLLALSPQIRIGSWRFTHAGPSSDLLAFISIANFLKRNPYFPIQDLETVSTGWSWIPQHQAAGLRIGDSLIHANLTFLSDQISPTQFLIGLSFALWLLATAVMTLFSIVSAGCSIPYKNYFSITITVIVCSSSFVVNSFFLQSSAFLFGLSFFVLTTATLVPILRGDQLSRGNFIYLGIGLASLVSVYPEALVLVLPTIALAFGRLSLRTISKILVTVFFALTINPFGVWLWIRSALIQAQVGENGFNSPFHDIPLVHFLARSIGAFGTDFLSNFNTPFQLSQDKAYAALFAAVISVIFITVISPKRGVIRSSGLATFLVWFSMAFAGVSVVRAQEYLEYRLLFIGLPLFLFCGLFACVADWSRSIRHRVVCVVVMCGTFLLNVLPTQTNTYLNPSVLRERSIDDSYGDVVDFLKRTGAERDVSTLFARDFIEQTDLGYLLRELPRLQVFNPWNVYLSASEDNLWTEDLGRFVIIDRTAVISNDPDSVIFESRRFRVIDTTRGIFSFSTVGQDWSPRAVNNPKTTFADLVSSNDSVIWVFSNGKQASIALSRRPGLRTARIEAFNLADGSTSEDPIIHLTQSDSCYTIVIEKLASSRWLAIRLEGPVGLVFNPTRSSC